jgi:4-hydroxy-tetrahydrodipicolinate reductase
MKIGLIGYGKMGKLIESLAQERGHSVIAKFSREYPLPHHLDKLDQIDIAIDFSHPDCVLENVSYCAQRNKNIIIGTTGWEAVKPQIDQIVQKHQIGCLYAPNFSIGIHFFMQIVRQAAALLKDSDYDVSGIEYHHRHKADSPSGTAKAILQVLLDQMQSASPPSFSSVRCGSIPGTHTLYFDAPSDSIILTHQARNREGFARGALTAAEWMIGKQGMWTLEQMLHKG